MRWLIPNRETRLQRKHAFVLYPKKKMKAASMRYLINNVTLSFFEHGLVPVICNSPKVCCVKSGGGGGGEVGG